MTAPAIELPLFLHREMTSPQCLDGGERLTVLLKNSTNGLPQEDWLNRAVMEAAAMDVTDLSVRMRLERGSQFSKDKRRAHAERRRYLVGIRSGARQLMTHPDPAIPSEKRMEAARVVNLFARYRAALRSQSQGETSAAVRLLLEACQSDEMKAALVKTDLLRLHNLLVTAQERYAEIVRQEECAEAGGETGDGLVGDEGAIATTTTSGKPSRTLREIKDSLASRLNLAFGNMAFLASIGREPYQALLAQCREITDEINSVIKLRDTLGKKAAAKKEEAEKAEAAKASPSQDTNPAPAQSAPRNNVPATTSDATAEVARDWLAG